MSTARRASNLVCALGPVANRNYYGVKCIRLPELLAEIANARDSGTYRER